MQAFATIGISIECDVRSKFDSVAIYRYAWWLSGTVKCSLNDAGSSVVLSSAHTAMQGTQELYCCSRAPAEAH